MSKLTERAKKLKTDIPAVFLALFLILIAFVL